MLTKECQHSGMAHYISHEVDCHPSLDGEDASVPNLTCQSRRRQEHDDLVVKLWMWSVAYLVGQCWGISHRRSSWAHQLDARVESALAVALSTMNLWTPSPFGVAIGRGAPGPACRTLAALKMACWLGNSPYLEVGVVGVQAVMIAQMAYALDDQSYHFEVRRRRRWSLTIATGIGIALLLICSPGRLRAVVRSAAIGIVSLLPLGAKILLAVTFSFCAIFALAVLYVG